MTPINGCCRSSIVTQKHNRGRTRFEGNRYGVYDGADGRPNFLGEFDLTLFWVVRDGRLEDNVLDRDTLEGLEVALCDG